MKILIAVDSFKGSMSSLQAGRAIAAGLSEGLGSLGIRAECTVLAVADGGEGIVACYHGATGGRLVTVRCRDPLGRPVNATFCMLPDGNTAVLETAMSSGLALVQDGPDILHSDTRGLGDQIRAALDCGARRLLIGLGGSATNDAGAGMAQALGWRFLDRDSNELQPTPRALGALAQLDSTGVDARLAETQVEAICDVDNPLLGPAGAARTYAPQKGADRAAVAELESVIRLLAEVVESSVGVSRRGLPGAGAAGGLGFGLASLLGARLRSGIDVLSDTIGLAQRVAEAALVVTGEGRLDAQSMRGKTAYGVARIAAEARVPVVAFCGSVEAATTRVREPFCATYEILPLATSPEDAIDRGPLILRELARQQAPRIAEMLEHR